MYLAALNCTVKYGLKKKEETPEKGGNEDAVKENREREKQRQVPREREPSQDRNEQN